MKLLNLTLSDEEHRALKVLCAREGVTLREWFRRRVVAALEREREDRIRREHGT